jgi:uncharacterized RDD family membrane protein YckC
MKEGILNLFRKQTKNAYPTLNKRMFAAVLDLSMIAIPTLPVSILIHQYLVSRGLTVFKAHAVVNLIQLVVMCAFVMVCWIKFSATPGKMLLSLKIVNAKDLSQPSRIQLFVRMLSYVISVLPLGLGIFYIAIDKRRRAWHDMISGTIVISKKDVY